MALPSQSPYSPRLRAGSPLWILGALLLFSVGACTNPETSGEPPNDATDTDGDGYTDYEEWHAGTDAYDSNSVIYQGGWPYNPDKEAIANPGWDRWKEKGPPVLGSTFPRFVGVDQFGEEVEIYDFAGRETPVMIDLATVWCSPCKAIANWMDDGDEAHVQDYPWWQPRWSPLPELAEEGAFYWITILYEDAGGYDAYGSIAEEWYEDYPTPWITVLADVNQHMNSWLRNTGIPTGNVLDTQMKLLTQDTRGIEDSFDQLITLIGDP
ncbi:MAG TPA: hypothetical protein DIU15_16085 [Deltaproteobacteria bacterium]|nr:hypothetical protein [Deltaproteobacteria bacterium]HCP47561.1 hypothetical protein [Deltaproteobacteria bacterium]